MHLLAPPDSPLLAPFLQWSSDLLSALQGSPLLQSHYGDRLAALLPTAPLLEGDLIDGLEGSPQDKDLQAPQLSSFKSMRQPTLRRDMVGGGCFGELCDVSVRTSGSFAMRQSPRQAHVV